MNIIFVHGMGRSSFSWFASARRFRADGYTTFTFDYSSSKENFESISLGLASLLMEVQSKGDYIVIGHSLGGVLLRAALGKLDETAVQPKALYLLGSPIKPSLLAKKLKKNVIFRLMTRDCGQLLASDSRMSQIPAVSIPVFSFTGVKGITGRLSPFGLKANDTVVAAEETTADWITKQYQVPVRHSFMPSNKMISTMILSDIKYRASTG